MGSAVLRASLLVALAGCQSAPPERPRPPAPVTPTTADRPVIHPVHAVARPATPPAPPPPIKDAPVEPVAAEPAAPDDPLSRAADCLDRGDLANAARHLEGHVVEHPDQVIFRAQLADLLFRMERLPEAQAHFEAAVARAQDGPPVVRKELVHYHTRLMEIARERADDYAEHLHRGIGLYLVGSQLADRGSDAGEVERMMCKAAAALGEAQAKRPDDARVAWYLYRVWSSLDQARPAAKALRQATAAAPFSALTPAEARDLALAGRTEVVVK
jgi:tetratricopeptide (TPR) repeat protein